MVKGVAKFQKRLRSIPDNVREEVTLAMQRTAERVVKEMRAWNPLTDADIEINWTWGDAPVGSVTVGKVAKTEYDKIGITIYARGRDFNAWWFEVGTNERFHKSGKSVGSITAQPFFWPVYRANEKSIRRTITAAVRRGVKKSA